MADMQAGIGPSLGVFLQQRGWTAGPIGTAIRREGEEVGFRAFLKVGSATMIPALVAALGLRILIG